MKWPEARMREMVELFNGYPFDSALFSGDGEIPLVRIRDIAAQDFETYISAPIPRNCQLKDGDLVIGMDGDFNTCIWTRGPAALNQRLCALRPRPGVDIRWVAYNLPPHLRYINETQYATTVKHLSSREVLAIRFPLPTDVEQKGICDFLDRETTKIDAVIDKQEQLIATLREDRIATITHAVTKGVDPDVEMKDSGVPWLGQIPSHWTMGKVKHGFSVVLGKMYQGERQSSNDQLLPHLKAGSVNEALQLDLDDPMLCWFTPEELSKLSVRKDDLLVVEGGATYGRCAIVQEDLPGWGFQKSLNRVRARGGNDIRFLSYLIQAATAIGHVSILCGKATIPHFTAEKLESLEWPHPSLAEQHAIVDFLARRCANIDTLISKATEVIAILREYQSALITDAVTGKIGVQGAVA